MNLRFRLLAAAAQQAIATTPFHQYTFADGTVWTEFHHTNDGYLLRFPGLADFTVSADGTVVDAIPSVDVDADTAEHLYVNQVLPLALSRQGQPTFHASAVVLPEGAIAFLGKTGMGKSTLAASFAVNRTAFLSDDALLIEERDECCSVLPGHASLRLWDDSAAALLKQDIGATSISYSGKSNLLAGEALTHADSAQPLLAAYVLRAESAAVIDIQPLTGSRRHMAWLHNSFLLDIEDPEMLRQHFDWTHRIACRVPTFSLDYPRDYGMLPQLRSHVHAHAMQAGS